MTQGITNTQSRSELFASEVLGKDAEGIKTILHEQKIVIGIDKYSAAKRQGQIGFVTAINVLARLGTLAPNIYLDVPDNINVLPNIPLLPSGQLLRQSALSFMEALASVQTGQPIRDHAQKHLEYDLGLFIGQQTTKSKKSITIGSHDWLAVVNPTGRDEPIIDSTNPLGILLAAALGSTEVVKHLWMPVKDGDVIIEPLTQRAAVSAFDLSVNSAEPQNHVLPNECYFGHACIFGLGAIGSACNFILGCFNQASLSVDMVDNDVIEPSNEERLFTSANPGKDIRTLKVIHAQQFLKSLNNKAYAFAYGETFERFVETSRDRLSYLFCCLDSITARRALQSELASVVVNGGTDLSRWMVSLYDFERPENACLLDLYKERLEDQYDSVQDLVKLLKISRDEISQLEQKHRRIDWTTILKAQAQEPDPAKKSAISRYMGLTFEQALTHVCSTAKPSKALPAATISFVSLIPAVFMVADFVKRRVLGWKLKMGAPNVFQVDSLRTLEKGTFVNILASENCFCRSKKYIDAFSKRQEIRKPHLNNIFLYPSHEKPKPTGLPLRYRRIAVRPQVHNHPIDNVQQVVNVVHPVNPVSRECILHLPSMRLCLLGVMIYILGMAITVFLFCLFAHYELQSKHLYETKRIVSLMWLAGKTPWGWLKYSVVLFVSAFIYQPLMKLATRIMSSSKNSKCIPPSEQKPKIITPQTAHKLLSIFFTTTGLPVVGLGFLLFGLVNLSAFLTSCKEACDAVCCVVIPIFIFFFYLAIVVIVFGIVQAFELTRQRCAWVFNLPIKKKSKV